MHLIAQFFLLSVFHLQSVTIEDFKKTPPPKSLVFISATCPCSKAHVEHIKQVTENNTKIKNFFVATESKINTKDQNYYKSMGINPIFDEQQFLIKKYKALKTPHAVIINHDDKISYEGGVTNKNNPETASKFYFKRALKSVAQNKKPKITKGRSLGCYIKRI